MSFLDESGNFSITKYLDSLRNPIPTATAPTLPEVQTVIEPLDPERPLTLTQLAEKTGETTQISPETLQGFQGDIGVVGDRPTEFTPSRIVPTQQIKESAFVIVGGKAIPREALGSSIASSFDVLPEDTPEAIKQEQLFTKTLAENIGKRRLELQITEGLTTEQAQEKAVQEFGVSQKEQNILNTLFQAEQIGEIGTINIQTEGGEDISPRRTALLLENALITGQKDIDVTFSPTDDIQPNFEKIEGQIRGSQLENLGIEVPVSLTPDNSKVDLSEEQFKSLQTQITELVKQGSPQEFITDPSAVVPQVNGEPQDLTIPLIIAGVVGIAGLIAFISRKKK